MSFILDALKKSESDRQRQGGPALYEVKVAAPRTHLPAWAIAIAVLLGVNLVIVAWVLLRHSSPPPSEAAAAPPAAPPANFAVPASATPAPAVRGTAQTQPLPAPQAGAPAQPAAPAAADNAQSVPNPQTAMTSQAGASASGTANTNTVPDTGNSSTANARSGSMPANRDAGTESVNPDDYEPATEPAPGPVFNAHVKRGTSSGLPLYQDAATTPGAKLPELRLDLHVYAAKPQERFVLINMRRLREGDTLPQGVRVESITPEGAVVVINGSRYLLPRE